MISQVDVRDGHACKWSQENFSHDRNKSETYFLLEPLKWTEIRRTHINRVKTLTGSIGPNGLATMTAITTMEMLTVGIFAVLRTGAKVSVESGW